MLLQRFGRAALVTILAASGFGLIPVSSALAADTGSVSSIALGISSDGSAPFDAMDLDGNNGIVRTHDLITYSTNVSYAATGLVTFTATLPAGMEWDKAAASVDVCNANTPGGGTITTTPAGSTLVCQRNVEDLSETFILPAWVYSVGNGTEVSAQLTAGTQTVESPTTMVAAETKTELRSYSAAVTPNLTTQRYVWTGSTSYGATSSTGTFKGYEALDSPFSYTIIVPPNATVTAYISKGGGSVAISPVNAAGEATVTVTGMRTDFRDAVTQAGQPANYYIFGYISWTISVPIADYPSGAKYVIGQHVVEFDPNGISGPGSSNFGAGYAPGQDPSYVCPSGFLEGTLTSSQVACNSNIIDRTIPTRISGAASGATRAIAAPANSFLMGDGHGYTQGREKVLPGESYMAISGVWNDIQSPDSITAPYGCAAWNSSLATLHGSMQPAGIFRDVVTGFSSIYNGTGAKLPTNQVVIEYASLNLPTDAARKANNCGVPGDGASGWVTDPTQLAGPVDTIRISAPALTLKPGQTFGLWLPLKRTTNELATNSRIPWFWQYGADTFALRLSAYSGTGEGQPDGGNVQAVSSLVRHIASYSQLSTTPGGQVTYTMSPVVIGPAVTGVDTTAHNVRLTTDFTNVAGSPNRSACVVPNEVDLQNLVTAGTIESYEYTPPTPGADGNLCTGDAGETAAKVVLILGDVLAPGGPPTGSASIIHPTVDGHETPLRPISFGVLPLLATPSGSTIVAKTVISSTEDITLADYTGVTNQVNYVLLTDRTTYSPLVINGVAAFSGGKIASTTVSGALAPGEEFSYSLSWGNGTATPTGPGTFVDVLPFDGDPRGTTGLGSAGITVNSLTAAMVNPATMGSVDIEYTTDPAPDVYAAVNTPGNENGATGVNWNPYSSGPVAGATAVRFITTDDLRQYAQGSATISATAPTLARSATVYNDMFGRTAEYQNDPGTVQVIKAAALVELTSSAATLSGVVRHDLDFSSSVTAEDNLWPAGPARVELVDNLDNVAATSDIAADGTYHFDSIAPETYSVRVKASATTDWTLIGSTQISVAASTDTEQDLLYQEVIAPANLVNDKANTHLGNPVAIDIAANDILAFPTTPGSIYPVDTIALGIPAPAYGTAAVTPTPGAQGQSTITYTPPATWPTDFTGQTSFHDEFTYTWADANGKEYSALVTVTIFAAVTAVDDLTTIADRISAVDVLTNDEGDQIELAGTPSVISGDVTATYTGAELVVTPTHTWATNETSFDAVIEYTIEDSQGIRDTATATVTVIRPPVITGPTTARIAMNGTTSLTPVILNPALIASGGVDLTTPPTQGTVTINPDGTLTFDGTGADTGTHTFTVTWTDEYGQSTPVTYEVSVQAPPTALGGTAIIGESMTAHWNNPPTTTGTIVSATVTTPPSAGNATVDNAGAVVFDAGSAAPGDYFFDVTFTDDLGQTGTAQYTVTIQSRPVVTGETSAVMGMGQSTTFNMNIATPGTITSAHITTAPSEGIATAQTDGTVTFDAGNATPGTYTFTVTFVDNAGQEATVEYTVTVQAPPALAGGKASIPVGGSHTFSINPVSDGNVTGTISKQPSAGRATLTADSTLVFDGTDVAPGTYTIELTYSDEFDQVVTAIYEVTVQAPPTGEGTTTRVPLGTAVVSVNPFTTTNGTHLQPLTEQSLSKPAHGTVSFVGDTVEYSPEPGFVGTDQYTVTMIDDLGQSVVLTFTVEIYDDSTATPAPTDPHGEVGAGPGAGTGLWNLPRTGAHLTTTLAWTLCILTLGGLLFRGSARRQRQRYWEDILR